MSLESLVLLNGSPIPSIIYGTAQRDIKAKPDVRRAVRLGYRAIDTASCSRFHDEGADGHNLASSISSPSSNGESVSRKEILIQSKYTPPNAQTAPWPYSLEDDTTSRVLKSVLGSATNLRVDVIDVYMLAVQLRTLEETLEAWQALENLVDRGAIRYLGLCNINVDSLRHMLDRIRIMPAVVQNWFRKSTAYDREVVAFCRDHHIVYQAFGVFDQENAYLLGCEPVRNWAAKHSTNPHGALLALLMLVARAQGLQLCFLDGATNKEHMEENLKTIQQVCKCEEDEDVESFARVIGWGH